MREVTVVFPVTHNATAVRDRVGGEYANRQWEIWTSRITMQRSVMAIRARERYSPSSRAGHSVGRSGRMCRIPVTAPPAR
jgi:hypothetical protein